MKQTAEGRRQIDDAVLCTALTQYFTTSQESDLVLNEVPLREALAIADVLIVSDAVSAYEIRATSMHCGDSNGSAETTSVLATT